MRHFLCNELEPLAYLIYLAAVLSQYSRMRTNRHKVLSFFYALAALLLLAGLNIKSVLNNWSYNVLFFFNICFFSWYFQSLLLSKAKKIAVICGCILNTGLLVYFDIKNDFCSTFNGYAYGISFITIVVYTLFYFHQLLENVREENILFDFDFWLVCGYLLYFLGSFFIVIYYEHVDIMKRGNVWAIQNGILFLCSVSMLLIGLKITGKQRLLHG